MSAALLALFVCLGVELVAFVAVFGASLRAAFLAGGRAAVVPTAYELFVGFVTDFLDTLGIGSFATTTSLYRLRGTVDDAQLPGTMNVGHTIPTAFQFAIYVAIIEVDVTTLVVLVASATLGGFLGAGVVSRWPKRRVQLGMAMALTVAAALLVVKLMDAAPEGGEARALTGLPMVIGAAACGLFGALMTIGVGAYAPILVTVSLLGMEPVAAFPIMMGACALLMPVAGARFVKAGSYAPRAALGLTLGGAPAVLIAAYVVRSLPLAAVQWLVLVVVVWTAASLVRAARRSSH